LVLITLMLGGIFDIPFLTFLYSLHFWWKHS